MKKICIEVYEYDNMPGDLALLMDEKGIAKFVAMLPINWIMKEV